MTPNAIQEFAEPRAKKLKNIGIFALTAFAVLLCSISQAAPKHYPQEVPELHDNRPIAAKGYSKLRIAVSSNEAKEDDGITVGAVSVCSETACYKPETKNRILNLYNTSKGKAERIYEVAVPVGEIKSIHFDEVTGSKVIVGDLPLISVLKLDETVAEGGDILVILNRSQDGHRVKYYPTSSAVGYYHSSSTPVYYNPAFATSVGLKFGVKWNISEKALSGPYIFTADVHDTGDKYPLVDIYPSVELISKSSLSVPALKNGRIMMTPESATPVEKDIKKTGVVRISANSSEAVPTQHESPEGSTAACVASVTRDLPQINSSLVSTGAVYYKRCEAVAPFLHIAIGNNADSRETANIAYYGTSPAPTLSLQRIETLGVLSQILVNGFTWAGDKGISQGTGLAMGFIQRNSTVLGNNRANGGISGSSGPNQLAFLIMPQSLPRWKEGINGPLWTTGVDGVQEPFSTVSSSTSIIKNGICSSSWTLNRWSAFGTTPDNKVIFASSTSDSTTAAGEMCAVFKALGANYAIRLDGSSAAGMLIDGKRVNPLVGADKLVFGSSRYVDYGLGFAYKSGFAPATPVIW